MSQHVYTRLTGFGWTLLPLAPFRFERVDGRERTVLAIHDPGDGPRRATIDLGGAEPTSAWASVIVFLLLLLVF